MTKTNFSLILPVRNEEDNIELLLKKALVSLNSSTEIIVVYDDASDRTAESVEKISLQHKNVKIIRNKTQGLASAIITGIEFSASPIVCWMDADLSMPVELVPVMLSELENYDVVIGSRYVNGGLDLRSSKLRVISSKLFNLLSRTILNTYTSDLTSGFVSTRKEVINKIGFKGKQGEYCIWLLNKAEKLGLKIKEIPYQFIERKSGRSKIGPNIPRLFINLFFYINMVAKCKFKDLFFYKHNNSWDKKI